MASPSGSSSAALRTTSISSSTEMARSAKRSPGWRRRRASKAARSSSRISGEKIWRARSGQVVGLVDQKDRVGELVDGQVAQRRRPARRRSCSRPRSRRRAGRELELDLERADLLAARLLEDRVGIGVRMVVAEALEDVGRCHLLAGSPWRTGRNPRGRGSGRWRTSVPWRAPGRCGRRRVFIATRDDTAIFCWSVFDVRNTTWRPEARPWPARGGERPRSCRSRSAPRR